MKTILQGVVGSTAYGLATPTSDIDRMGIFIAPTSQIVSFHPPKESVVTTKPDVTMHEVGKFLSLVLRCNPSVTELLWLDEGYELMDAAWGMDLVQMRRSFLSAPLVKNAYLGYATQQFKKLLEKHKRTGTLGHEDVHEVRAAEASFGVLEEQQELRSPGDAVPILHQREAEGGVLGEAGAVPGGEGLAQSSGSVPRGYSGEAQEVSPPFDVRVDVGGARSSAEDAERGMPHLRGTGDGSGSLSHHGGYTGPPVSAVQPGTRTLQGQSGDASEGAEVPGGGPGRSRVAKHARHLRRLVEQGFEMYTTGKLTVKVADPEGIRHFGQRVEVDPEVAIAYMARAEANFADVKSALPDHPDEEAAERWLIDLRKQNWEI